MSKEADRVVKLVELSKGEPNFAAKVEVTNDKEFTSVVAKVADKIKDTVVLLVAAVDKTNTLFAGLILPNPMGEKLASLLTTCTADVTFPGSVVEKLGSSQVKISYPENSEHFAFKLVERVIGAFFHELKRLGLHVEAEEEQEYNWDDLLE